MVQALVSTRTTTVSQLLKMQVDAAAGTSGAVAFEPGAEAAAPEAAGDDGATLATTTLSAGFNSGVANTTQPTRAEIKVGC